MKARVEARPVVYKHILNFTFLQLPRGLKGSNSATRQRAGLEKELHSENHLLLYSVCVCVCVWRHAVNLHTPTHHKLWSSVVKRIKLTLLFIK